mgnify:CR=1 FL=1
MENDGFMSEWMQKTVTYPNEDGFVYKIFKKWRNTLSFEEQQELLNTKKKYFWQYIPDTTLCQEGDEYYVKQKYIKWRLLRDTDISTLSQESIDELIDLVNKYVNYCKCENRRIDLSWYHNIENYYSNKVVLKLLGYYLTYYKNFLKSTNIIIWDDGHVHMVDVCDPYIVPMKIQNNSLYKKIKSSIRCELHNIFIQKNLKMLENCKKDLISVLSEN